MADREIGNLVAKLVLDVKDFTNGIESAKGSLQSITRDNAWKTIGNSAKTVAKDMTVAGGAIVSTAGLAAKAAIDFEDAFAGVKKTVDFQGTEEEATAFFNSLEEGIREMSHNMPVAATEIAGVAEAAGQLGIQNDQLLSFTETMIGLGSATNVTAEEAAVALAQFANVTQMSQTEFDNLGSSIVELGNNMATDEASIINMSTELANLAQSCGMSEADIMGMSAALSSMGLDAAASGTAMQRFTMDIVGAVANGGPFLEMFAETAGMTADEFAAAWRDDATGALLSFLDGLSQMGSAEQLAVFSDLEIEQMREIDMLQRMAGNTDLVREAVAMSNEAWQENSALTEEVGKRNETTASQLEMVKNMVTDIAVEAGKALLPVIKQLLEQAKPLLDKVSEYLKEHPDTVQRITETGAALLAIGGTISTIVKVVSTISTFITAIKSIGTAIGLLTGGGAAAAGGGAIAGLIAGLSSILPVVAAVAAAVGVFALAWHKDWGGIREKFGAVKEWIVNKFGELKKAFEDGGLQGAVKKIGTDISDWWRDSVTPWFEDVKQKVSENFQKLGDAISERMNSIFSAVRSVVSDVKDALSSIGDAISSAWDKITSFASAAAGKVSGIFGGGRASGGYMHAGTTYLVGELGPELITPTRSGYVHTAEETSDMMGGETIVININGDVYDDERSMRRKMKNAVLGVLQEQMAYG